MRKNKKLINYSHQRGDWVTMMKYIGRYGKDKGYYERFASQEEIDNHTYNMMIPGTMITIFIIVLLIGTDNIIKIFNSVVNYF